MTPNWLMTTGLLPLARSSSASTEPIGKSPIQLSKVVDHITVKAAYMGRLGTGHSCLLYQLSLISVVQLTGLGRPRDRNMRAN